MRTLVLGCSALMLATAGFAHAQSFTTAPCHQGEGESSSGWLFGRQERACELRRATLPVSNGRLAVYGKNGGVTVDRL